MSIITLFINLLCKITNPTILPLDVKTHDFEIRLTADLPVSSLYRSEKDGEYMEIIVENEHIDVLRVGH